MSPEELKALADAIEARFTPHAFNCTEQGCGQDRMNTHDWARFHQMEDIVFWIRAGAQ